MKCTHLTDCYLPRELVCGDCAGESYRVLRERAVELLRLVNDAALQRELDAGRRACDFCGMDYRGGAEPHDDWCPRRPLP